MAHKAIERRDVLKIKAISALYEHWKGDALIRANFYINPEQLQISEWNKLYAQAFWLKQ